MTTEAEMGLCATGQGVAKATRSWKRTGSALELQGEHSPVTTDLQVR